MEDVKAAVQHRHPIVREATEFAPAAYWFDGRGGVSVMAFDGGPIAAAEKGFVLVAGSLSSPDFRHWLAAHHEGPVADGLTATDTHTRCSVAEDYAHVMLKVLRTRTEPEELSRQTVSVWIEKNRAIMASKLDLAELVSLAAWQKAKHAPVSPADLLARMGIRAADRAEPLIRKLSDSLDSIEVEVVTEHDGEHRQKLTRVRRALVNLRRILWPQRDIFNTLEMENLAFLSPRDRARLRDASNRSARLGQELDVLAERAALVQEQVIDYRSERMNRTMLVLTAATVIAMPMTVVSGLLGMNVEGIPFAKNPEAFWLVVLGLAAIGTAMIWFMRARKWL